MTDRHINLGWAGEPPVTIIWGGERPHGFPDRPDTLVLRHLSSPGQVKCGKACLPSPLSTYNAWTSHTLVRLMGQCHHWHTKELTHGNRPVLKGQGLNPPQESTEGKQGKVNKIWNCTWAVTGNICSGVGFPEKSFLSLASSLFLVAQQ